MKELKMLIESLIKEIEANERIVNVKGGKGGGTGTAYPEGTVSVSRNLGHEEAEKQEKYKLKPVKISKIFLRKNNGK